MNLARIRLAAAALFAGALVVGGLAVTPAANAAITGTSITTPSNPAYFIADNAASSQNFTVSGTATGATSGDTVDINCYFDTSDLSQAAKVATNVPVTGGAFSVSTANLGLAEDGLCDLRAVPSGTTPSSLSAYSGPTIGVGERDDEPVASGPNSGKNQDFYVWAQQATGAFDYRSLGQCGVYDGYLFTGLALTTTTFYCGPGLFSGTYPSSTRSELQVDGTNAYAPGTAADISSNTGTSCATTCSGLPSVTETYTVDMATGNTTITETDPIVKCTVATYPPNQTSCATFTSAGVTDHRTITQDNNGHTSLITDQFSSTDGKAHSLDLLWDNTQHFWGGSTGDSQQLEYEFPGQSSFSLHTAGDSVSLPASGGTILIRMNGAADGDTATGQGAIVYNRPATAANFEYMDPYSNEITLHQTGSVPAGGSTSFKWAFVQDYHAANVASDAQTATKAMLNTITVSKAGKGKGTVSSSPSGISCGKTCSAGYAYGASVTLAPKAAKGSTFTGFSGACKGKTCKLAATDNMTVKATFGLKPCKVPNVVGKKLGAAKSALKKALCSVGKVKMVASSKPTGQVIAQSPKHGKKVKQHSKVNLTVSKG
jgi:PASTA domain